MTLARLHARARAIQSRALVRQFEYRQRNLSSGVWTRLRLALARAERAQVLDAEATARLVASGRRPLPVGLELEPPLSIFVLEPEEARALAPAREIAVRIDEALLGAGAIGLVEFECFRKAT